MELDDTVCFCFHVTKRKIVNFIRITRPRRASQLSECFGAGTGCGWCRPLLVHYFVQMVEQGIDEPGDELAPERYAALRRKYLRGGKRHEVVRDELAEQGLELGEEKTDRTQEREED